MKNIAVFCSASTVHKVYVEASATFASLLGKNHYNLVCAGSDKGLMKVVQQTVRESGGKLIGITVPSLGEVARNDMDEMIVAQSLYERKAYFLKLADAFVALVGGIGTLDELLEIAEIKKHGAHNKPLIILNTHHFYDFLISQMQYMEREHFFPRPLAELIYVAQTPSDTINYLNSNLGN